MMKKRRALILSLLLIACILFSFTACSLTYNSYVGITSAEINKKGELIITYEDGKTENLGKVVGKDGDNSTGGITVVGGEGSNAVAVSAGLRSAVSIIASFEKSSTSLLGKESYASAGAGVIYSLDKNNGDAYIITNYHVVYDSESLTGVSNAISVYFFGKEWSEYKVDAEYVGGSMTYDIAVLKITDCELLIGSDYSAVTVADSETIHVGDAAIAIGNPDSMGISATIGIISVDSEYITMTGADGVTEISFRVMRIDTAVNPGNSGGGLFNAKGELIGIFNAMTHDSTLENIAYSIPTNIAVRVAESIIYYCDGTDDITIKKPLMGVTIETVGSSAVYNPDTGRVTVAEQIAVREVTVGSAADGKLMAGDVFKTAYFEDISFDVTRQHQIIDLMLLVRAGDTVSYDVIRNGETVRVDILITEASLTQVA